MPKIQKDEQNNKSNTAIMLRARGLRPTRQRCDLVQLLFDGQNRHLSVEEVHDAAIAAGMEVSLATVYNALNCFTRIGLLREVVVAPGRVLYDTHVTPHHHFYLEDQGVLIDVPEHEVRFSSLPKPPKGTVVRSVEVILRVTKE